MSSIMTDVSWRRDRLAELTAGIRHDHQVSALRLDLALPDLAGSGRPRSRSPIPQGWS
jgi:hypothetical protein